MPYRTLENKVDGVVITFSDITALKRLEGKLENEKSDFKKQIVDLTDKKEKDNKGLDN
jgi:hypothetical protein